MPVYRSVCPLDCFDNCIWQVHVEDGKVVKIAGDPDFSPTKGFVCSKARKQIDRLYSPDRLLHPLRSVDGRWQKISWEQAYEIIADKLTSIIEKYGSQAILHHSGSGSNGILKTLDRRFFNALGGATVPAGSPCWGSGLAATEYDFGACMAHTWEDHTRAKTIILWGRDPFTTNPHLVPYLKEAQKNGAQITVINPIRVPTSELADRYVSLRPGTDGALALGMAHCILRERWLDWEFVRNHVEGFAEYARMVKNFPPEKVAKITGVSEETIVELAREYAIRKPSCIILGYGMQRYTNGGQTVRAINSLAAITGNIGVPGGGVNYAFLKAKQDLLKPIDGRELARKTRTVPFPTWGSSVLSTDDPPIKCIFVTRSNPVTQLPNTAKVVEAFKRTEFVVVIDFFLNDTADLADLVLPCTTVFEEEDIIYNSMNYHLAYAPQLVKPLGEAKSDPDIFMELAEYMGLQKFFNRSKAEWLREALEKAVEYGVTLERLKKEPVRNPLVRDVAWEDKKFLTPSGKFELYSERAAKDGLPPLPVYREPKENVADVQGATSEYPLQLITPHPAGRMHSQFLNLQSMEEAESLPSVEIHPETARQRYIRHGEEVIVESRHGQIRALAKISSAVRQDTVKIEQGWWIKEGGGVNFLTPEAVPDMGLGVPYYDCGCEIRKIY
ncbi:molybdopterin-containing oxidoreductase family protein [Calderihabitans maritimus]|uniref:Nitrate reductase n=1 Tax=Calderihabitans maritimus TaxID=1246530 RepID=A0A1Z5HW07_9FIRM|nr:molybdopterin-dependent oxidoreductase [Calderihabitans maritimus]GAW93729.1 nitrate reductase [Calderihabitans maritimus]